MRQILLLCSCSKQGHITQFSKLKYIILIIFLQDDMDQI